MKKLTMALLCAVAAHGAWAQSVTAEEMMMLDDMRAKYKAAGKELSPEDEARILQRVRAIKALVPGGGGQPMVTPALAQPASPVVPPPAAVAAVSESDLRQRLRGVQQHDRAVGEVVFLKDGITFDGQRFADPEGRTSRFVVDAQRGRVAYTVGAGERVAVKLANLQAPTEAVTLGHVVRQPNQWVFTSVTGKTLAGELFFPLTDGVLVLRDSVGFRYVAGDGVQQINIPTGWYPTPLQRGNISTTGWLLLEKDTAEERKSPLGALIGLGKIVGLADASDYALLNVSTGKMVPININSSGKNTYAYSQCRRKNALVNVCDQSVSYESTFQPDGSPNPTHYFWRADWMATSNGPVLIAKEGSMGAQVNAWDLQTGKKVTLLERTLGVGPMNARVLPDGRMQLSAQMGFGREVVEDVAAELQKRPDLMAEAKPAN